MREYQRRLAKMAIGWMMAGLALYAWSGVEPTQPMQRPGRAITRMEPVTPYVETRTFWVPTLP